MQQYFIAYKQSVIRYLQFGNGPKWLFFFHGYGEDANSVALLERLLEKEYTMIAMDLPLHGKTVWNEGLLIEAADFISLINLVKPPGVATFSLAGYSLGGRIALMLLQLIPQQIERLVLIAPDGLHENPWYWFCTQTWLGNRLLKIAMRKPALLFTLMKIGSKTGVLKQPVEKVANYYLANAMQRELLYKRWTTLRKLRPNMVTVKSCIEKYQIPIRLLFGVHDKIILSKRSNFLTDGTNGLVKVTIAEAGHQLLKEKYVMLVVLLFYE